MMYYFNCLMAEDVLIYPLSLKDICTGYRICCLQFLSLSTLKVLSHFFLPPSLKAPDEKLIISSRWSYIGKLLPVCFQYSYLHF